MLLPSRCLRALLGVLSVWAFVPILTAAVNPTAGLRVSSETVPPGGMAQIKIFLVAPLSISGVSLAIDFDPAIFGEVAAVFAFSSTGDTYGYARVQDGHLAVSYNSLSGGIGQLPDVPILEISIPVLASAPQGSKAVITVSAASLSFQHSPDEAHSVTGTPGTLTVGGALSIQSVFPGGGVLPAGALVRIDGTGFSTATNLEVDGVSVVSVAYASRRSTLH